MDSVAFGNIGAMLRNPSWLHSEPTRQVEGREAGAEQTWSCGAKETHFSPLIP